MVEQCWTCLNMIGSWKEQLPRIQTVPGASTLTVVPSPCRLTTSVASPSWPRRGVSPEHINVLATSSLRWDKCIPTHCLVVRWNTDWWQLSAQGSPIDETLDQYCFIHQWWSWVWYPVSPTQKWINKLVLNIHKHSNSYTLPLISQGVHTAIYRRSTITSDSNSLLRGSSRAANQRESCHHGPRQRVPPKPHDGQSWYFCLV